MTTGARYVSAVLIVSEHPARLAAFYRDVLGIPLNDEQHDDTAPHWGCQLGAQHFAIHPPENFRDAPATGPGGIKLALRVDDLPAFWAGLPLADLDVVMAPTHLGWSHMAALRDPDGHYIEFVQLKSS